MYLATFLDCANEFYNSRSSVLEREYSITCASNLNKFYNAGFRLNVYTLEGVYKVLEYRYKEETLESELVLKPTLTPTKLRIIVLVNGYT